MKRFIIFLLLSNVLITWAQSHWQVGYSFFYEDRAPVAFNSPSEVATGLTSQGTFHGIEALYEYRIRQTTSISLGLQLNVVIRKYSRLSESGSHLNMPLFIEGRQYLNENPKTPFIYGRVGIAPFEATPTFSQSTFLEGGIGYTINQFLLSAGYKRHKYTFTPYEGTTNLYGLRISYMFK